VGLDKGVSDGRGGVETSPVVKAAVGTTAVDPSATCGTGVAGSCVGNSVGVDKTNPPGTGYAIIKVSIWLSQMLPTTAVNISAPRPMTLRSRNGTLSVTEISMSWELRPRQGA
jgi:hypothetical protein